MKITHFKGTAHPLTTEVFLVRRKVFIEEQKVNEYEEFDEYEEESVHFAAQENGKVVATSRYRLTDKGVKLERFAVLKTFRNKGIGREVLVATLNEAIPLASTIYLHAQLSALDFYLKNGFVISGELFTECDILHYPMIYQQK